MRTGFKALGAALALTAAALLAGCGEGVSETPAPEPPPRPAFTMVVGAAAEGARAGFPGSIQARSQASLGFPVMGRVIERLVDTGDSVRSGQKLAALDPLPYQLTVQAARSDLEGARAQRDQALGAESRAAALVQGRAASQAVYDGARLGREAADASVSRAEAALLKAQEQLDQTVLRARADGVVTQVQADPGQTVQPGQPILVISDLGRLEAVIDPPEDFARGLSPEARFQIRLRSDPSVTATARLREIAPQADSASRTRRLRLSLENPPRGAFWAGVSIDAIPQSAAAGPAGFALPATAILEQGGSSGVWVVGPDSAVSLRRVRVEPLDARQVRVLEGLTAGERVVTSGVHSLEPGRRIRVQEGAPR